MSTFDDILKMRAEDVDPPKPLPPGMYLGIVDGQFSRIPPNDKGTEGATFTLKLIAPNDSSISQEELNAAGGCAGRSVQHRIYVTKDSSYFLKSFLETLGIDPKGKTIEEMMAEAPGRQLGVKLKHMITQKDQRLIHVVDSVVKL
jgi:hypothetical protein